MCQINLVMLKHCSLASRICLVLFKSFDFDYLQACPPHKSLKHALWKYVISNTSACRCFILICACNCCSGQTAFYVFFLFRSTTVKPEQLKRISLSKLNGQLVGSFEGNIYSVRLLIWLHASNVTQALAFAFVYLCRCVTYLTGLKLTQLAR